MSQREENNFIKRIMEMKSLMLLWIGIKCYLEISVFRGNKSLPDKNLQSMIFSFRQEFISVYVHTYFNVRENINSFLRYYNFWSSFYIKETNKCKTGKTILQKIYITISFYLGNWRKILKRIYRKKNRIISFIKMDPGGSKQSSWENPIYSQLNLHTRILIELCNDLCLTFYF